MTWVSDDSGGDCDEQDDGDSGGDDGDDGEDEQEGGEAIKTSTIAMTSTIRSRVRPLRMMSTSLQRILH